MLNRSSESIHSMGSVWPSLDVTSDLSSTTCLLAVTSLLAILFLRRHHQQQQQSHVNEARLPPGSMGWPIVGETIDFVIDGRRYFRSRREKYGSIFKTHLLGRPTVVVIGAENVRRVLTADDSVVGQAAPGTFPQLFGRSLTNLHGSAHRSLQRLVLRAFNHENLSCFAESIQQVIRAEVSTWPLKTGSQTPIFCVPICRKMSLDIICHVLLGFDLDSSLAGVVTNLFTVFSEAAFAPPINLPGFAFHKGMAARRELLEIVAKKCSEDCDHRSSILRSMWNSPADCDDNNNDIVNDQQHQQQKASVLDVCLELMYGGHETTTSVLCSILIQLANRPDVIDGVRRELKATGVTDDFLTYDTLRSLSYTRSVVREVLRINPPVAGAFRVALQPLTLGKYSVPEGWGILYGITDTHETTSMFDQQLDFDPSRWQRLESVTGDDVISVDGRYGYIPFGGGSKRFCVGKEFGKLVLTVFVVELVRSVSQWRLVNGPPRIKTAPIPVPKDDLPIVFSR